MSTFLAEARGRVNRSLGGGKAVPKPKVHSLTTCGDPSERGSRREIIVEMSDTTTFTIACPDCGSDLVVDAATGKVLSHRSKAKSKGGKADFDSLLANLDASKTRAEEIFDQELSAFSDRERVMEEKFKRALERAEEEDDGKAPERPWDFE
ncbi:MAG: hypothetical protein AAGF23_00680 [Acidobacteriota bacterium]